MRILVFILIANFAHAFWEVGISGSFRESFILENYSAKSSSLTGSVSYYFMERSAIQVSFTQAVRRENVPQLNTVTQEVDNELNITETNIYGLDFVLSFSDRKAPFQPFIKAGVAQLSKKFTRQFEGLPADTPVEVSGVSLSGGIGMKIRLTKTISFNVSFDGWTAPINEDDNTIDTRALVGLSWFF